MKNVGAYKALHNGANISDLQKQLRHHSLEMTQIYLNAFDMEASPEFSGNFPAL